MRFLSPGVVSAARHNPLSNQYFRRLLVVAEVALAIPLLVGAGLLIRTFSRLSAIEPGFAIDHLLIADLPVAPAAHPKSPERMAYFDEVAQRAAALPSVESICRTHFFRAGERHWAGIAFQH